MLRLTSIVVLAAATAYAWAGGCALGATPTSCPVTLPVLTAQGPGATLVPPGARSLLLCSYRGLNPPSQAHQLLRHRALADGPQLAGIVREFDALPARSSLTACPMDDGSGVLALFGYASLPTDEVTVGLSGCQVVTNGRATRTASLPPGPALLSELKGLLG